MRIQLATLLMLSWTATVSADAPSFDRTPAPKKSVESDRAPAAKKPVEGKTLCIFINGDQNAPSTRGDCIAEREPVQQRPAEKSPPKPPGDESAPVVAR